MKSPPRSSSSSIVLACALFAAFFGCAPFPVIAGAAYVGSPSNPTALQAAITSAYNAGSNPIIINPGTYSFPANSSNFVLQMNNMSNVVIDAYGVTISATSNADGDLVMANDNNVTFAGAVVGHPNPQSSQGTIEAIGTYTPSSGGTGTYVDVLIDAGYRTDFTGNCFGIDYDPVTRHIKVGSPDMYGLQGQTYNSSTGYWRFYFSNLSGTNIAVGDPIAFRGTFVSGGYQGLYAPNNVNCTVEDCTFSDSGGFVIQDAGGSGDHYYRDAVTYGAPPPGGTVKPLLASCADGIHCSSNLVGPDIENCLFEGMGDDGIAVHGSYNQVQSSSGTTIVIANANNSTDITVGDTIRAYDTNFNLLGTATVESVTSIANFTRSGTSKYSAFQGTLYGFTVTLSQAIPGLAFDCVVCNPEKCGAGYKLLNNTVRYNRARGILVKADNGTIENNLLEGNTLAGIEVAEEVYFAEADFSHNVTISNNVLRSNAYIGGPFGSGIALTGDGGNGLTGHQNISITNNLFDGVRGCVLQIEYANGVTVANNLIQNATEGSGNSNPDSTAVIWLANCNNVSFSNNLISGKSGGAKYTVEQLSSALGTSNPSNGVTVCGTFELKNKLSSLLLDGPGAGLDLDQNAYSGYDQLWNLSAISPGFTELINQGAIQPAGVGSSTSVGSNLVLEPTTGASDQLWEIQPGSGSTSTVQFVDGLSNLAVNVSGGSTLSGAAIVQNSPSSSTSQQWTIGASPQTTPAASANPNQVTGTNSALTVGNWTGGVGALTFTWSLVSGPAAAAFGSNNGTTSGQTCTATFSTAGQYTFLVKITDSTGAFVMANTNVTVEQTPTTFSVTPSTGIILPNGTLQVTATLYDQFGDPETPLPEVVWSVTSGLGTVAEDTGLYTASSTSGTSTVTATTGYFTGSCVITVSALPAIAAPASASPTPVTAKTTTATVLGEYVGGESSLTYTWSATGPAAVAFSANGTNASKSTVATFAAAGAYVLTVTVADPSNQTATSSVNVTVNATPEKAYISPSPGKVNANAQLQMLGAAKDQFGNLITNPPLLWAVTSGGGTINASGVYTAPATTGTAMVTVTSGAFSATSSISILNGALGELSGSVANPGPLSVNLTTEGTTDWIHWGSGVPGVNHKSTGGSKISGYTLIGSNTPTILLTDPRSCSWSDGTPTASASNNKGGLSLAGVGSGFSFTAPADLSLRTLTVYVGGKGEGGQLTAHISDGSSPDYVNVQPLNKNQWDAAYTITYEAASAGQTIQISWVQNTGTGTISLTAADLH